MALSHLFTQSYLKEKLTAHNCIISEVSSITPRLQVYQLNIIHVRDGQYLLLLFFGQGFI